jgi:hypothetical protein
MLTNWGVLYLGEEPQGLHSIDKVLSSNITWPSLDAIKSNSFGTLNTPLRRDTLQIAAKSYAILAIKADNPGS